MRKIQKRNDEIIVICWKDKGKARVKLLKVVATAELLVSWVLRTVKKHENQTLMKGATGGIAWKTRSTYSGFNVAILISATVSGSRRL